MVKSVTTTKSDASSAVIESKRSATEMMAARLHVSRDVLISTLKKVAFIVRDDKTWREPTDEEFVGLVVVANTYKLNPLTKEIYAFLDTKRGGRIVPIVSTDGWNKIMTTHNEYRTHKYNYAENTVTPDGGKPCPEWIECVIEKTNGSKVEIREYLDECYQPARGGYAGPWQTHTKRMLRHKAKIAAAREAFGFGGIYDIESAAEIIDAETTKSNAGEPSTRAALKPSVTMPEEIAPTGALCIICKKPTLVGEDICPDCNAEKAEKFEKATK